MDHEIALGCSWTCHSRRRKRTLNSTGGSQNVLGSEAPNIKEFKQTWLRGVTIEQRGRKGEPLGPELWNKENDSIVVTFLQTTV